MVAVEGKHLNSVTALVDTSNMTEDETVTLSVYHAPRATKSTIYQPVAVPIKVNKSMHRLNLRFKLSDRPSTNMIMLACKSERDITLPVIFDIHSS